MDSAFGVDHGEISKLERRQKHIAEAAAGGTAAAGAGALAFTKMPEHSHFSHETRKKLNKLPAGEHDVPTKWLTEKKPRKLGARKQQKSYVAAMTQERPRPYPPVPITRHKDGVIQRDNAHTVMADHMTGQKTTRIKLEDSGGYRPSRRTGEELVRRAQSRFQQRRLRLNQNLSDSAVKGLVSDYKPKSRKKNTSKRPHGVVEEGFKTSPKPFGATRALGLGRSFAKRQSDRDIATGATGAAGVGVLGSTPVRRSARKVDLTGGRMKSSDAKKVLNPGWRPKNKESIRRMSNNLGSLQNTGSTVVRYKDGRVIPWDGNHRGVARVARGDKSIPVKTVQGKERPAVSVTSNAYHVARQKVNQSRMNRGVYKPTAQTAKHAGQSKSYGWIANASPARSGRRALNVSESRFGSGPTKAALRTKQGATVATGAALLGTAGYLHRKRS